MAFFESPRFPEEISYDADGGPGYKTDIVTVNSGFERRNIVWADARNTYDVSHGLKSQVQLNVLVAFFRCVKGRGHGFRFKDWSDYSATAAEGSFVMLTATTFQMVKKYTSGANIEYRTIKKPAGTIAITGGVSPTVNTTNGVVTVSSGTPSAWAGQFDVPCRFDTDEMHINIEAYNVYTWGSIPVVEIRV